MGVTVFWFRRDLRLADQPALREVRGPVVPLFVWSPEEEGPWALGGASRWWLGRSLRSLANELRRLGSPLVIRRGPVDKAIGEVVTESGADTVCWTQRYEPDAARIEDRLVAALERRGIRVRRRDGATLYPLGSILTDEGRPYRVFTPFRNRCARQTEPAAPLAPPDRLDPPPKALWSETLSSLGLDAEPRWAAGLRETWRPGEPEAQADLASFVDHRLERYPTDRDRPDRHGSSRLSPRLAFGELSPRQVWHAAAAGPAKFREELLWREFAAHLLHHYPRTATEPLQERFAKFPWRDDPADFECWRSGRTGYPLVDAGMRELWHTGWMHNRVRMVVASFLVKHLLLDWRQGARWFWDTLVDADLANNTLGWQWSAGCGADAAPFFRIFSPIQQGERYDPEGGYVRRWVPELAAVPDRWLHRPWSAPSPPAGYPPPMVDHRQARARALAALAQI